MVSCELPSRNEETVVNQTLGDKQEKEILNEAMKIKKEDDFMENEHSEINLYVNFNA